MDIENKLKNEVGNEKVLINEKMSKHTSFKTGGTADFFVKIENTEDLKKVLKIANEYKMPLFILGNGSNILVKDNGIRGIVCKININKFEVEEKNNEIFVTVR